MKIALVDDEQIYLEEMSRICRKFGEENNLQIETALFSDGEDFLRSLDGNGYSVVFMDIYMDGINGVSAAQKLRERDSGCVLVFLTSSSEHMPEAFSCHAFEYVTKPFTPQRVEKILRDAMKVMPQPMKYIDFYSDRKNVRLLFDEIVSVITDAHYIDVETTGGKTVHCRMTMSQFMEQTSGDPRFILINKGIAVNADYIDDFENNCCIMYNGTQFPIRVRDCQEIKQSVQKYNFDKIRSRQRCGK